MKSGANERFSYVGKERKRPRQVVSGDLGRGAGQMEDAPPMASHSHLLNCES